MFDTVDEKLVKFIVKETWFVLKIGSRFTVVLDSSYVLYIISRKIKSKSILI